MFEHLGRTGWIDAAGRGLARLPYQVRPTLGTFLGHVPRPARRRSFLRQHAHDFGDDVAGALDDDVVAGPHVFPRDLVRVVQGCPADRRPPNLHGCEPGDRGDGPRPPDVDLDVVHDRLGLFRRELEGEGPARAAGHEAELRLLPEVVDLDDDPVDPIVELVSFFLPRIEEADDGIDVGVGATVRVDVKAHLGEPVEDLLLTSGPTRRIQGINERVEAAAGGDPGIELPDRSRGSVARIGEERLAFRGQLGVEALKAALRHVDLTANLEGPWKLRRHRHRQGDAGNRLDVRRHVFADVAVATGRPDLVAAVLVQQAHREAVDLQLGHVLDLDVADRSPNALVELTHLIAVEGIAEAQHRRPMGYLRKGVGRRSSDSLGRRVGRDQLGMLRPQDRCSTWSPGWYRCTSSTGTAGRAASTTRAGAMPASGTPCGIPADPSTRAGGMSLRKRDGRFKLALPNRCRRNA